MELDEARLGRREDLEQVLAVSSRTVRDEWARARAWLLEAMRVKR